MTTNALDVCTYELQPALWCMVIIYWYTFCDFGILNTLLQVIRFRYFCQLPTSTSISRPGPRPGPGSGCGSGLGSGCGSGPTATKIGLWSQSKTLPTPTLCIALYLLSVVGQNFLGGLSRIKSRNCIVSEHYLYLFNVATLFNFQMYIVHTYLLQGSCTCSCLAHTHHCIVGRLGNGHGLQCTDKNDSMWILEGNQGFCTSVNGKNSQSIVRI